MNRFRTLLSIGLLLSIAPLAYAQEPPMPAAQIEAFFATLGGGESSAAIDALTAGTLIAANQQQVILLKGQVETAMPLYGEHLGFEPVHREELGDSLLRFVYLQKFEAHPLIWEFYYYRDRNDWTLIKFQFNDQMDLLGKLAG